MSARPRRIEVITGVERRRRWTLEQKQAIVEESLSGHATPTMVARKHGIGTGQLYTWRHRLLGLGGIGCWVRLAAKASVSRVLN